MIKLPVDVEQGDPHDEDSHENVKQDPKFDEQGNLAHGSGSKEEHPVFQDQKPENLVDGALPAHDQEKPGEKREKRDGDQEGSRLPRQRSQLAG